MDGIDITAIVVNALNIVVFCPILAYLSYSFHHYKNYLHIKQRNTLLVYIVNVLVIFTLSTERVYLCCVQIWKVTNAPLWTAYLFSSLTWIALYDLFAIKVYNLYFQQQYNVSIAQISWTKEINPNYQDWYISHKQTFGNPYFLLKIASIPYIISVFLDAFIFPLIIDHGLSHRLFHALLLLIPICIAIYIFWNSRLLNDLYQIRNEIFYQFLMFLACLFIFLIVILIGHFGFGDDKNNDILRLEWLLWLIITDGIAFCLSFFSTLYPIYLIKHPNSNHDLPQLSIRDRITSVSNTIIHSNSHISRNSIHRHHENTSSNNNNRRESNAPRQNLSLKIGMSSFSKQGSSAFAAQMVSLATPIRHETSPSGSGDFPEILTPRSGINGIADVISDFNTFKRFMSHLVSEFCAENLLFLVELIQIKYAHQRRHNGIVMMAQTSGVHTMTHIDEDSKYNDDTTNNNNDGGNSDNTNAMDGMRVVDFNAENDDESADSRFTYIFHANGQIMIKLSLPSDLPTSSILSQCVDDLNSQMFKLFEKYVRESADHELNIPYSRRLALTRFFEKKEYSENSDSNIFNVLDEVAAEVLMLLQDSCSRFVNSDEFKEISDIWTKVHSHRRMETIRDLNDRVVIRNADSYSKLQIPK